MVMMVCITFSSACICNRVGGKKGPAPELSGYRSIASSWVYLKIRRALRVLGGLKFTATDFTV